MADNDLKPMDDGAIVPPSGGGGAVQKDPVKTTGSGTGLDKASDAGKDPASGKDSSAVETKNVAGIKLDKLGSDPKQALKDGAGNIQQLAGERLRSFADTGKERAGGALDGLSQLLTDAAAQVDDRLGSQYGQYARSAADQVQGFAETVRNQDVDDLVDTVRNFVRTSPAAAVGVAAAVGFAAARVVQAGIDADAAKRA